MSENIPVRFVKPWRSFFKDDVAGFPGDVAEELVTGGAAVYHDANAAPAAPGAEQSVARTSRNRGKGGAAKAKGQPEAPPAANTEPTDPPVGEGAGTETPAPGSDGADDQEKP